MITTSNIKKINFIIILFSLLACKQYDKNIDLALNEDESTCWIEDRRPLPEYDSLFYLDRPAPLFRKAFVVEDELQEAKLLITAAGYYKATINAQNVGNNVLDPAWTDYSRRIYYSEYDVSTLLKDGTNCIGVTLGNGFYNPLPLRKWGRRNLRSDLVKVGKPTFISKLVITYKDGRTEEIASDTSWKYAYGPMLKNDVYLGVVYDARKEIPAWDTPGFNDALWSNSINAERPGGALQKAFFPPVQVTKKVMPVEIYSPENGKWIVDMGVNFTGTYRIRISGDEGDSIIFRFGERIYDDGNLNPMTTVAGQIKRKGTGGPGAPDIAWQTDTYIIGTKKEAWFIPDFTYHTYRYMEISGLKYKPEIEDIKGLFIHSNVQNKNSFSCSSELLNAIQDATERTFLANLASVQSDCPAREKFGYGGDLNATSESFICNFDMQSFYRKTIYDWLDAMNDSLFVDTAPYVGLNYCGLSWESAYLITQYYLYLYYKDENIVRELYSTDKKWMQKAARIHPQGWVDKGLSDHESMEPVPVNLTGTAHYLQCARIMTRFATLMGDEEGITEYMKLAERLEKMIREEFWDKPVDDGINRQTLFATLLYHDIIPVNELEAAADSLLQAAIDGPSGHFNTGIFGTKYILETLSEYAGVQVVYEIVNSRDYPGWGYMIDKGATTIWETWKESDNVYSNCHPMFGSVSEWFYRRLAGIRPDPDHPGFERFIVAPSTPVGLDFVNCTYFSPYGKIVSNWRKEKADSYVFEVKIPTGSRANVILAVGEKSHINIIKDGRERNADNYAGLKNGNFELPEGDYTIRLINRCVESEE